MKLFSYWRSSCSYRVRIVLHYKDLPFEYIPISLLKNEHEHYENPEKLVPFFIGEIELSQSCAIMEYLNEQFVLNLLPKDIKQRAKCRQIMQIISCDIQPLQNMKILKEQENKAEYARKVIFDGLLKVERLIELPFCLLEFSLADCCLIPQVYNAKRFNVDFSLLLKVEKVNENCLKLDCVKKAHPNKQPDAPEAS